jgi:hypothetical protein
MIIDNLSCFVFLFCGLHFFLSTIMSLLGLYLQLMTCLSAVSTAEISDTVGKLYFSSHLHIPG